MDNRGYTTEKPKTTPNKFLASHSALRNPAKVFKSSDNARRIFAEKYGIVPESTPEETNCPPWNWNEKFQSLTLFHGVNRYRSFKETNYFFSPCREQCKWKKRRKITPYDVLDAIDNE